MGRYHIPIKSAKLRYESMKSTNNTNDKQSRLSGSLHIINQIFLILTLFFAGIYLYKNTDLIVTLVNNADLLYLGSAFCIFLVFELTLGLASTYILQMMGSEISISDTLPSIVLSGLGKYIPGKIWIITMRSTYLVRQSVSLAKILVASAVEHVFIIISALLLFLITTKNVSGILNPTLSLLIILLLSPMLFFPNKIHRFVNWMLKYFKRDSLPVWINRRDSVKCLLMFTFVWLVLGTGVFMTTSSFYPSVATSQIFQISGLYAISAVIGILAIFAPGGIGVREGVFIVGLKTIVPLDHALLIAVAVRLLTTVSQLTISGIMLMVLRVRNRSLTK